MKKLLCVLSVGTLCGCGNPGGISDDEYANFKELGAPKILYSCKEREKEMSAQIACLETSSSSASDKCIKKYKEDNPPKVEVSYIAGVGIGSTYNSILEEAKGACRGEFKVLESK